MSKIKLCSLFIGMAVSWPVAAHAGDTAGDCPLHKQNAQTAAFTLASATAAPLDNAAIIPISYPSSPENTLIQGNLPASPPFEASDRSSGMTADGEPAIAPSQAVLPSAPIPSPVQYAQAPDEEVTMSTADKWDDALGKYVKSPGSDGLARFDYAGLNASSADKAVLTDYIAMLEGMNPDEMSENAVIAYWANLYNAVTVQQIIENYPVESIKDIKSGLFASGPWKKDLVTVNGQGMSLDDIEHGTLRKKYPSPLIHYMVNCASVGCPNLKDGLWTADTLDADRDMAARAFINSPRGADITSGGLTVSSIYKWFDDDFGGNKAGVLAHLSEYADADLKAAIDGGAKITGYDYNWSLNE